MKIIFLKNILIMILTACFLISGPEIVGEFKHHLPHHIITEAHEHEKDLEIEKGPHTHTEIFESNDLYREKDRLSEAFNLTSYYLDDAQFILIKHTNKNLLPLLSDDSQRYFETFICRRLYEV
jgi:hypothetical protein